MKHRKPSILIIMLGTMLAVVLGLTTYHFSGLHEAVATRTVEYGLGLLIVSWFVFNVRNGLLNRINV